MDFARRIRNLVLSSLLLILGACSRPAQLKGDPESLAKNYIEGAIQSIRRSEFAEAELYLLKAELLTGNQEVTRRLRAEIQNLSSGKLRSVDKILECALSNSCNRELARLQSKFCKSRELDNDEYTMFLYLGGQTLQNEPSCRNEVFNQLIYTLRRNPDYFDFAFEKNSSSLSKTEKKILNFARAFKVEGRRELFNNLPNDILVSLLEE